MLDIKTLTVEQKLKLLTGANLWENYDVDGKLYKVRMGDGPNGLRKSDYDDANPESETAFPTLSVAGSSWDREIIKEMADAIADEAIEEKIDLVLGPGINIKRSPYCGRNFEYLSEDPYFSGEMGKVYIEAMQKRGIGTSLKHFAVNNSEWDRLYQSSEVSERAMQEIYLAGFKKAVEAEPWTIMCSYNPVNGVYAAENRKLLKQTLRDKFGYKNVIVSDWGAVLNSYKSLKAGLDMRMPYHEEAYIQLKSAYEKGLITDEMIDESAQRIIDLAEKAKKAKEIHQVRMTRAERHQKAVKIAENGIVLLKNEGGVLPLTNGRVVIGGAYTKKPPLSGNGAAMVKTDFVQTPLNELLSVQLPDCKVEYVDVVNGMRLRAIRMRHLIEKAYGADVTIVAVGNTNIEEGESWDRENIKICPLDEKMILETAQKCDNVVVLLYTGSSIDCSSWIDNVKACVWVGFSGEGVNEALANILTGKVNPSGKLTETFPIEENVYPASNEGNGFVTG
ncbi:MAG: glycoside hydrolase family 3 protein, partial [Clostridia bacterium]|nr:glycoside hydrolase family 3 protein [Clostridia bacterium]